MTFAKYSQWNSNITKKEHFQTIGYFPNTPEVSQHLKVKYLLSIAKQQNKRLIHVCMKSLMSKLQTEDHSPIQKGKVRSFI